MGKKEVRLRDGNLNYSDCVDSGVGVRIFSTGPCALDLVEAVRKKGRGTFEVAGMNHAYGIRIWKWTGRISWGLPHWKSQINLRCWSIEIFKLFYIHVHTGEHPIAFGTPWFRVRSIEIFGRSWNFYDI